MENLSEHQQLIAALSTLIMEQRRTTEAVERLLNGAVKPTPDVAALEQMIADTVNDEEDVRMSTEASTEVVTPPTEAYVKAALITYSKATDRDQAKALLAEYDAKKVGDVAPDKRAELIAKALEV